MIRPIHTIPLKARLFRSLGDEGRCAVLEAIVPQEQRVGDIVRTTGQSQSTVSTHLATLHAAGLAMRRSEGRGVWYGRSHPAVVTLLGAAEEIILAASAESYACLSPCCSELSADS